MELKTHTACRLVGTKPLEYIPDAWTPVEHYFRTYIDYSSEYFYFAKHLLKRHSEKCGAGSRCFERYAGLTPLHEFLTALNHHAEASQKLQTLAFCHETILYHWDKRLGCNFARMKGIQKLLIDCISDYTSNSQFYSLNDDQDSSPAQQHIFYRGITQIRPRATIDEVPLWHSFHEEAAWSMSKSMLEGQVSKIVSDLPDYLRTGHGRRYSGRSWARGTSAKELEAEGYRTDWSSVKVEVVETKREHLWRTL